MRKLLKAVFSEGRPGQMDSLAPTECPFCWVEGTGWNDGAPEGMSKGLLLPAWENPSFQGYPCVFLFSPAFLNCSGGKGP